MSLWAQRLPGPHRDTPSTSWVAWVKNKPHHKRSHESFAKGSSLVSRDTLPVLSSCLSPLNKIRWCELARAVPRGSCLSFMVKGHIAPYSPKKWEGSWGQLWKELQYSVMLVHFPTALFPSLLLHCHCGAAETLPYLHWLPCLSLSLSCP